MGSLSWQLAEARICDLQHTLGSSAMLVPLDNVLVAQLQSATAGSTSRWPSIHDEPADRASAAAFRYRA